MVPRPTHTREPFFGKCNDPSGTESEFLIEAANWASQYKVCSKVQCRFSAKGDNVHPSVTGGKLVPGGIRHLNWILKSRVGKGEFPTSKSALGGFSDMTISSLG